MNTISDFVKDINMNARLRNDFLYALRNLNSLDDLKDWFDQRNVHFMVRECSTLFSEIRRIKLMRDNEVANVVINESS